jgi:hypothetical protein
MKAMLIYNKNKLTAVSIALSKLGLNLPPVRTTVEIPVSLA